MNKIFIVVKRGRYNREVIGVWDDLELAKKGAELAIAKEPDGYHDMNIIEGSLNEMLKVEDGRNEILCHLQRIMKKKTIILFGYEKEVDSSEVAEIKWL